nr:metallophosphoesterase [Antrihabitans sp. YC2-6]
MCFAGADAAARCNSSADPDRKLTLASPIPAVGVSTVPAAVSASMVAGVADTPVPDRSADIIESSTATATTNGWDEYPHLRYTLRFAPGTQSAEITWRGHSVNNNDLAMHVRDPADGAWGEPLATGTPSEPGGPLTLSADVAVRSGVVELLVVDSPRADRRFAETNAVPDQTFADPATYDFALQHISDTQYVSRDDPAVYRTQTQWTVENADPRKIAYSMHTGDLIQSWIRPGAPEDKARKEFEEASRAMKTLEDAGFPHGVLPGNHDNIWNVAGRLVPGTHEENHALYNEFFGPQRYRDRPYWGGSVSADDNSAHYDLLEIAGARFLFLSIGYNPPEHVMRWAEDVLADHPDHNAVIGTHYYLDEDGSRRMMGFGDIGESSGQQIWNRLVVPNQSVFMVLAGHVDGQTVRVDREVDSTGRTVVQLLADYQYFEVEGKRSTGFQRLLQFDLDGGTIAVNTHSPGLNTFSVENYDPRRRFDAADGEFVTDFTLRADVPRQVAATG